MKSDIHKSGNMEFGTRVQAEMEMTVNRASQEQWQNQDRNMKICWKMHARAEVMINMASKTSHFPLSRRNILFFAQHRAESPSQKWWC